MIFKDLINVLKTVKSPDDITQELVEELTIATISANMSLFQQDENCELREAFEMSRATILRHMDDLLISLNEDGQLDEFGQDDDIPFSPMNDPQLQKEIQRAIEAYNKRVEKEPKKK